ncbi:MAG: hypothetical protein FJX76_01805 [Armatimonadetes bacterium]|nr:hypothetical protein [Armatimonadota bacterium]
MRFYPAALLIVSACVMVNNYAWLQNSEVIFGFDFGLHASRGLHQWDNLRRLDFQTLFTLPSANHGPLSYLSGGLYMWLTEPTLRNLVISSSLWVPVYALTVYWIGRALYDEEAGFWAGIYFLSIPLFVSTIKQYPLEIVSQAFVAMSLAALFASDMLRRRRMSLAFGLLMGLGMLTKAEYPVMWSVPLAWLFFSIALPYFRGWQPLVTLLLGLAFVGGNLALAYVTWEQKILEWAWRGWNWYGFVALELMGIIGLIRWRRALVEPEGAPRVTRFWNLAWALGMMLAVVLPFVLGKSATGVYYERMFTATDGSRKGVPRFDPMFYWDALLSRDYGYFYFSLLLIGIALFLWVTVFRRERDEKRIFFYGMFLFVCVMLNTTTTTQADIYVFNILVFSAVAATWWIFRWKPLRWPLLAMLTVCAWLQVFGWVLLPLEGARWRTYGGIRNYMKSATPLPILPDPPSRRRAQHPEMLHAMHQDAGGPFVLAIQTRPPRYTVYDVDGFRLFGMYERIPVVIPFNIHRVIEQFGNGVFGRPEGEMLSEIMGRVPFYVAIESPTTVSETDAARIYAEWMSPNPPVRATLLRAFPQGDGALQVFRVRPGARAGLI